MPLQNRVLPTGDIVAIPARGTMTGNRGILHREDKVLGPSRWTHKAWICCALEWQGRKRDVMTGRNWTELFFLDEAVAMAAGHRPCGYCRRNSYKAFQDAWQTIGLGSVNAKAMDNVLHAARILPGTRSQQTYCAEFRNLPNGTFLRQDASAMLRWDNQTFRFGAEGYEAVKDPAPTDQVEVLTAKPMVKVLQAGFVPKVHKTLSD